MYMHIQYILIHAYMSYTHTGTFHMHTYVHTHMKETVFSIHTHVPIVHCSRRA